MRGRNLALLPLLLLLLTACGAPPAVDNEQVSPQERLVARFSHVTTENSPKHLAAVRFAQEASSQTGGRVEIQVYPNSQLYKDGEEISALQNGSVQFIAASTSKLVQVDPMWQVFDLPYLFTSFADIQRLFDSPAGLVMRQRLEAKGMIPLAIWPNGFKQLTNMRHPLVKPSDFAGLTFRVQGGLVLDDQFRALGAGTVVTSFDAVYADLEHQEVDGQENTLSNIYTRNLQALQPYLTISDHGYLAYVVLVQAKWWKGLDEPTRAALQIALSEATDWIDINAQVMNDDALAKIEASGRVQVRTLTPDERQALRVSMDPAYKAAEARLGAAFMKQVYDAVAGQ